MDQQEIEAAKRWFITRFVHGKAHQEFCLRLHGLDPDMTEAERQKLKYIRTYRYTHLDFQFIKTAFRLVVQPNNPDSDWCTGIIWWDSSPGQECFVFRTMKRIDLFTDLDR